MTNKVLLADDSLTIQKVIKITLNDEPYDIIDCPHEDQLEELIGEHRPGLVLLDFNLSESMTGYDLCKKIKELSPESNVLVMYGTFDTIDEDLLSQSGAANKIVKPFDSNKFVSLCKNLISGEIDSSAGQELGISEQEAESLESGWEMQGGGEVPDNSVLSVDPVEASTQNALEEEISDWGADIPGVIGQEDEELSAELPPVMDDEMSAAEPSDRKQPQVLADSDDLLPSEDDLAYPDMNEGEQEDYTPKSKLVSMEELKEKTPLDNDNFEESTDVIDVNELDLKSPQEEADLIESQIEDEMSGNLWDADEEVSEEQPAQESVAITSSQVDHDVNMNHLKQQILNELRPEIEVMMKSMLREFCQNNVEKVSWEVIPDLAENLINKQLKELANKALDQ